MPDGKIRREDILSDKAINETLKALNDISSAFNDVNNSINNLVKTEKTLKSQINKNTNAQNQLVRNTKTLVKIQEEKRKQTDLNTKASKELIKQQEIRKQKTKELREEVKKELGITKKQTSFTKKLTQSFQNSIIKITAVIGAVTLLVKGFLNLSKRTLEVNSQTKQTEKIFGLTNQQAKNLTIQIRSLAAAYDKDYNDVLKSTNILSKEFGITGSEALDLIEKGFKKGADVNGEFLELLKEYPSQLKTVGLNASETIAIITQTEQQGIFSDKGIDAIKEAGIRLREMTPATKEALNTIGLSGNEIEKSLREGTKTLFEVTQDVSRQLSTLPPQSKEVGQAIADIFGGPGEDAGLRFLTTLKDIDIELDNLDSSLTNVEENQRALKSEWNEFIDNIATGGGTISKVMNFFIERLRLAIKFAKELNTTMQDEEQQLILKSLEKITNELKILSIQELEARKALVQQGIERAKAANEEEKVIDLLGLQLKAINNQILENIQTEQQQEQERQMAAEAEQQRIAQLQKQRKAAKEIFLEDFHDQIDQQIELEDERSRQFNEFHAREIEMDMELDQIYIDHIKSTNEERLAEEKRINDLILQLRRDTTDQTIALINEGFNFTQSIYDAQLLAEQENLNARLNEFNNFYDEVLENESLTADQRNDIEDARLSANEGLQKIYARKEAQIRRKQAILDRTSALFNIAVDTAQGVMSVLSTGGGTKYADFGISAGILSALVIATGALQAATVLTEPLPQIPTFSEGGKTPGGAIIAGEKGIELGILPTGRAFLTPDVATLYPDLPKGTEIIPNDIVKRDLANIQSDYNLLGGVSFDYKKFEDINTKNTNRIIKAYRDNNNQVTFDENTFRVFVKKQNTLTEKRTRKYRTA